MYAQALANRRGALVQGCRDGPICRDLERLPSAAIGIIIRRNSHVPNDVVLLVSVCSCVLLLGEHLCCIWQQALDYHDMSAAQTCRRLRGSSLPEPPLDVVPLGGLLCCACEARLL